MIQLTSHMKIYLAIAPVDFRKGIDGLAQLAKEEIAENPFSGAIFVFKNRRSSSIKILTYDGQGFWLLMKRLSKGKFQWWPKSTANPSIRLDAHQLQVLLWDGDPSVTKTAPMWRRLEG